jgi:hypothetical protein
MYPMEVVKNMSQQQFDPYNQPVQPTEYAANPNPEVAPTEYAAANPYAQPAPNPYAQPQPITNPYAQPQPVVNPYAQPAASPYGAPLYAPMPQLDRGRGMALAGLILGIIGIIVWLIPFFGFPVTIVGIILSALGRRSTSRKGMALAGLVLGIVGLVLTIACCSFTYYSIMH